VTETQTNTTKSSIVLTASCHDQVYLPTQRVSTRKVN